VGSLTDCASNSLHPKSRPIISNVLLGYYIRVCLLSSLNGLEQGVLRRQIGGQTNGQQPSAGITLRQGSVESAGDKIRRQLAGDNEQDNGAMSDDIVKALETERKARKLDSIPETVRSVLGEYFKTKIS